MTSASPRDWIWLHRKLLLPWFLAVTAVVVFLVSLATGVPWPRALFMVVFNIGWWAAVWFLLMRAQMKRKSALDEQGISIVHIRYPGSAPGSLGDLWAGGIARCGPGKIVFQETMDGTDVPLGRPKTLDVVELTQQPELADRTHHRHLFPGWSVLRLTLAKGELEVAAEPQVLAKVTQEVLGTGPSIEP
ncbi:hypothetical protein OOZ51_17830 [Arthrobacter sp. MI7-26]|uniref:hypothetical protein n=1 Tax=Arthrobacter sp. MI7-26 TaxID=2993653 RepID=UPI0022488D40|nr:hypothetical protein [Arthrobacter sp. MI7-26]MCX2749654.1 hypothetical protein [Arthrobacter sp. MI7-26]